MSKWRNRVYSYLKTDENGKGLPVKQEVFYLKQCLKGPKKEKKKIIN